MFKVKKAAFIVKDHKTYPHAEEAWYQFYGKKAGSILFIVIPKGDPNNVVETLEEIVDHSKWEEIVWVKTWSNFRPRSLKVKRKKNKFLDFYLSYAEYIYNRLDTLKIKNIAAEYNDIELVFSGHKNTQEHLAAKLNPKELYLLDSGNFIEKIGSAGFIDYSNSRRYRRSRIGKLWFYLTGLDIFDRKKTKIFTIYADTIKTKHETVKNNQDYKKHLLSKKKVGEYVLFISTPVYTLAKGVHISQFIEYLRKTFEVLDVDPSKVLYVPNPIREKTSDVIKITEALGCSYDDRSIPIEIKITNYKNLPRLIISPYSTALLNINEITKDKIPICCAWHSEFKYFRHLTKLRNSLFDVEENGINFLIVKDAPKFFDVNSDRYKGKPLFSNFTDWNRQYPE